MGHLRKKMYIAFGTIRRIDLIKYRGKSHSPSDKYFAYIRLTQ